MTTKTYRLSSRHTDRRWHVLDANGLSLGRVASEAAKLLLGKHKPTYEPHMAMGDFVVVVNAQQVRFTADKLTTKIYYRHSGYPGGLRSRTLAEEHARDPRRVIERAVRGMLPRNSLGRELFRHLNVYPGPDHPHTAQVMAGTGARARARAAQAQSAAAGTAARRAASAQPARVEREAAAVTTAAPRPQKPLARWLRTELDAEATRLGIALEPKWKKTDVIAAIEAHDRAAAGTGRTR